jgi:hypothetical protein
MRKIAVVFLLFSLCFARQSFSQDKKLLGTLSRENNSVTKVMQKAGCDFSWLSQVIADSGISVSELRRLPIGQKVLINSFACSEPARGTVATYSAILLKSESRQVSIPSLQAKIAELETSKRQLLADNGRLNDRLSKATYNLSALERQGEELSKRPPTVIENTSRFPWYAYTLFGFGACLFLAGISTWKTEKMRYSFPREKKVVIDGINHIFRFVDVSLSNEGPEGRYRCPLCNENHILAKNVELHLRKSHPGLRLDVSVDPSLQPFSSIAT